MWSDELKDIYMNQVLFRENAIGPADGGSQTPMNSMQQVSTEIPEEDSQEDNPALAALEQAGYQVTQEHDDGTIELQGHGQTVTIRADGSVAAGVA